MLGWYELPDKDRPPRSIWLDQEALNDHFDTVNSRYSEKGGSEDVPDVDEQNELTKAIKKGKR